MKQTRKRKLLATILAVMMVFQISVPVVFAADALPDGSPVTGITKNEAAPTGTWDTYAADGFAGGRGTIADPYQIATAEQLAHLAKLTNNQNNNIAPEYHYLLVDDIDLSAHRWIPIGRSGWNVIGRFFKSYFDGNNKTISGLYVDETEVECYAGLFGNIVGPEDNHAPLVQDLMIEGAYIATKSESHLQSTAGILCGFCSTLSNNAKATSIQNVSVSGEIERGDGLVISGGLLGMVQHVTIANCSAAVNISSKSSNREGNGNAGGLIGQSSFIIAKNSVSNGTITGAWCLGGFIGEALDQSQFDHCASHVSVTGYDWNLGGFVGYIHEKSFIKNSVAYGDITSSVSAWKPKAGGFAGTNERGTIQNCHADNTVKGIHPTIPAGGFIGYDDSKKTVACSFDTLKNPSLNGVGEVGNDGSNEIAAVNASKVLENICEDYYDGHAYSTEFTTDKEATCTEVGSKSKHCSRCDSKSEVSEIPMTAHTPGADDGDCTTAITCSVCGRITTAANTDHTWNNGEITTAATPTDDGVKTYTCKFCAQTKTEVIPATGPAKVAEAKPLAETAVSGITATNDTTADDLLNAVIEGINSVDGVAAAWRNEPVIIAATEDTDGSIVGVIVLTCGNAKAEIAVNKVIVKLPHTHAYGTEWKSDTTNHWHECTANDGAKSDMAAHTASDWITDKAATETETGSRHKECTVCKYVMQTEEIPTKKKYTYEFTNGQNSEWKQNSSNGLTFTVDGDFANFISIRMDGKIVDPSNYTAKDENNSITLEPAYLKTLSAGKHTMEIVFTEKSASADFTVQAAGGHTDNNTFPQTGDSGMPILPLMILMAVSGGALVMMSKKRKSRV